MFVVCFEGIASHFRRVSRRFVCGSREISLVSSLHRASTDALIEHGAVHSVDARYYYASIIITIEEELITPLFGSTLGCINSRYG